MTFAIWVDHRYVHVCYIEPPSVTWRHRLDTGPSCDALRVNNLGLIGDIGSVLTRLRARVEKNSAANSTGASPPSPSSESRDIPREEFCLFRKISLRTWRTMGKDGRLVRAHGRVVTR